MINSIVFNNANSYETYNLGIIGSLELPTPNVEYEKVETRGNKTGEYLINSNTYKNLEFTINFRLLTDRNTNDRLRMVFNWLKNIKDNRLWQYNATKCYKVKALTIDKVLYNRFAEFSVHFICEPFLYAIGQKEFNEVYLGDNIINNSDYITSPIIKLSLPNKVQDITINLSTTIKKGKKYMTNRPLQTLPSGIRDIIKGDKIQRNIAKIELKGNEGWQSFTGSLWKTDHRSIFVYYIRQGLSTDETQIQCKSNVLKSVATKTLMQSEINGICYGGISSPYIMASLVGKHSAEEFQALLKQQPITFYYPSNSPILETINYSYEADIKDDRTFTIYNAKGNITIDCNNFTVINEEGEYFKTSGKFPYLNIGENTISWKGELTDIQIKKNLLFRR